MVCGRLSYPVLSEVRAFDDGRNPLAIWIQELGQVHNLKKTCKTIQRLVGRCNAVGGPLILSNEPPLSQAV